MEPTTALLQQLLTRLGYLAAAAAPGELDEATRDALRRFQQLRGLAPTGEPDERTWEQLHSADERGECLVVGQLRDRFGPIAHAVVTIQDRELGDPAAWPVLGSAATDGDGRFLIVYQLEQVLPGDRRVAEGAAVADLVVSVAELGVEHDGFAVERLPGGERVTDDELALGMQARRVEELRIVVSTAGRPWVEGESEYERVLAAFQAVWPEVSPAALDESRREPAFVARELDLPQGQIEALAGAFRLHERAFDRAVPAPILYGLARCDQHLGDMARLALARSGQIKAGILQAVEGRIIPPQPAELIDAAIRLIRDLAPAAALADSGAGYGAVLSSAIPDPARQAALLRAAAGRQADPAALWERLRADPQFAEPGLIERAQFALQLDALTGRHLPLMEALQAERGISSARALLALDPAELQAIVERPTVGVPADAPGDGAEGRAAAYVGALIGQLQQAFPTETVAVTIARAPASAVGGEASQRALSALLGRATSEALRAEGAAFDLRTSHIDRYLAAHGEAVLADVAEELRPQAVAGLKRAQRLYRVSTGPEAFDWLLRQGYDSAFAIAQIPQQVFVAQAQEALGEHQALLMHSRAAAAGDAALATYVQLNDAMFGVLPAGLLSGSDRLATVDAIQRAAAAHLPSWSALLGSVAWCDCPHCRSVYSPAAYLVDLLHFLDRSGKNGAGQSPLDILLRRRPDLAQLKLTCENTNTLIPYVDLVNEVLESLVVAPDPLAIPAFETAGATSAEQRAAPQHTAWAAYLTPDTPGAAARLDRAIAPAGLPFDAPLATARASLEHLGVRRADLIAAFDPPLSNALAAERLGMSPAAFAVITGVNLDETPSDLGRSLDDRYGWGLTPPPALALASAGELVWALKLKLNGAGAGLPLGPDPAAEPFDAAAEAAVQAFQIGQGLAPSGVVDAATWERLLPLDPPLAATLLRRVPTFLERAALTYDELLRLLRVRVVNPEHHTFEVVRRLRLPGAELLAYVQAGLQNPGPALVAALQAAGVSEEAFAAWAAERLAGAPWARLAQTILAEGPPDTTCDLSAVSIRHWDEAAPELAAEEWRRLDQLIRLWRALGWPLDDLDLALAALNATSIDAALVRQLAQISLAAQQLELSLPQIVALWADLDPNLPGGLYQRRFLSRTQQQVDAAFIPDWAGRVLAGARIGDHLPALQAGLRLSGADLAALRAHRGLSADDTALDLPTLSELLRWSTLARALQLNLRDLIRLAALSGIDPFQPPGDTWALLDLAREARQLQASGLNAAQLAQILGPTDPPEPDEGRDRLITTLRDGLRAIAADLDPTGETDGALTRRALSLLTVARPAGDLRPALSATLIDAALQVVLGTDEVGAALPAAPAPPPAIPPEWAERLRYNPAERGLTCRGALTDSELITVKGFSADAGYRAATDRLHAAPRATLQALADALAADKVPFPATADLLAESLMVADQAERERRLLARLRQILDAILPPLRDRLSRTLIKQALTALPLEAATIALALEGVHAAGGPVLPASDPAQPLISDLLALATDADQGAAVEAYTLLTRLSLLIGGLSLPAADAEVLVRRVVRLRGSPRQLGAYADWRACAAYARIRARPAQPPGALARLWQAADADAAQALLAEILRWPAETIAGLMAELGLGLAEIRQLAQLERLVAAGELVQTLGVTPAQAAQWARAAVGRTAAEAAQRAVRARYPEQDWLEVARALNDPLRDERRRALVAYLGPRLGARDANGLYQQLLIDVEMSPCMQTSRIKQAIASVQLFIQRCLLNLEAPQVRPQAIDRRHWQWMQNYRVWEANRKVLLYPENWIAPELRDDKTPFFSELESALLQDDVTAANVERALVGYLEKLDTVAKLDIVAIHVQEEFEPQEKLQTVVHLFGRTANPAHSYFYRRHSVTANGTEVWTPWEAVPVDIQGSLIAPVVFNRRLYLFWAVITTKTKKPPAGSKSPQPPQAYQEIQLAWSEYRNGAWSPKHTTDAQNLLREDARSGAAALTTVQGVARGPDVIERLDTRIEGDRLRVLCIASRDLLWTNDEKGISYTSRYTFDSATGTIVPADGNTGYTYALGSFVLDHCHGRLVKDDRIDQVWRSSGFMFRLRDGQLQLKSFAQQPVAATPILAQTFAPSQIVDDEWAHEGGGVMVFSDTERAYLALFRRPWPRLGRMLEQPFQALPDLKPPVNLGLRNPGVALLKHLGAEAETARNSWAGAGATLAAIAASGASPSAGAAIREQALAKALEIERIGAAFAVTRPDVSVRFEPLSHPFVCTYLKRLQQYGVAGVFTLANQQLALSPGFAGRYRPQAAVERPYPADGVDFGATAKPGLYRSTAYAIYNWELFFHVPMLIADRLSQNQRYEEALQWYHYVFNPTDGQGGYWKLLPFQKEPKQTTEEWLALLSAGDPDMQRQIAEWRDHPFQPHRIARMRLPAYQKYVLMRYLDTLIAWGDQLFERDTIETINQATQLYILAAELLGPRPARLPARGEPAPLSFAEMRGRLDALSNVAAEYENAFPTLSSATMGQAETVGLLGISRSLYFCLPPNDKLLAYWDTVADRLFKIRNCMNLAGVVRQLPLFEPPIDPALLVRAAAQGIDLGSVLSDLSAPLPFYRFPYLLQKALEACAELKALGASLLSALEKRDAEALAALRATHETTLLQATLAIRRQQEAEADAQIEALQRSRELPVERLRYSRWLMGSDDMAAPEPGAAIPMLPYGARPRAANGVYLIPEEQSELDASHSARDWQARAADSEIEASNVASYPNISSIIAPWGGGVSISYGGSNMAASSSATARSRADRSAQESYDATRAGKMAGYLRRAQEYAAQANAAAREIMQIDRQITAATIRREVARLEREQIERQIAQAELVEEHLRTKYTNRDLYGWMQGQIAAVYFQSYQLAYDLARQAERCFRFERGLTSSGYIQFGAWDSLRKGLLTGEKLHLQLKQLERAYQDQHRREFELTRAVSLLQHDPLALIRLKETGRCEVELPELLFDMDYPGHYMRRIKAVSLTIPAVVGPYTPVNATLTMLANETRISSALPGGRYERDPESEDGRFVNDFAAIQSIATSGAQNDSGMFELNFRDERYLPFEGAGAAGRWRIEIDPDCNRFDLDSISDLILQIRYTARDGGQQLRQKAKDRWKKLVKDQENTVMARLFSMRHEFPSEWHRLQSAAGDSRSQLIALTDDRFPRLFQRSTITISQIELIGVPKPGAAPDRLPALTTPSPDAAPVALERGAPLAALIHQVGPVHVPVRSDPALAGWRLSVADPATRAAIEQLADLLIVCRYSVTSV